MWWANPSRIRMLFQGKPPSQESCRVGKRALQESPPILRADCDCNLPFVSKPGRRPAVYKRALQAEAMLTIAVKTCVAVRSWLKIPVKTRSWDVTECLLKAWKWWGVANAETGYGCPKNDSRSFSYQRIATKLSSVCTVQWCSMEAKALIANGG